MKELKFIHITKSGGTSIEDVGKRAGYLWGRHHKEYGFWHNSFSTVNPKIRNKYDWFAVVRNPYTRLLSEFHCKYGGVGDDINNFTKEQFNKYIRRKIRGPNEGYLTGHYVPQYKYFDLGNNHNNVVVYILKFENLETEFNDLMNKYNINVRLILHNNKTVKKFTIDDFDNKTLKLINRVYKYDFKFFGYDKKLIN